MFDPNNCPYFDKFIVFNILCGFIILYHTFIGFESTFDALLHQRKYLLGPGIASTSSDFNLHSKMSSELLQMLQDNQKRIEEDNKYLKAFKYNLN